MIKSLLLRKSPTISLLNKHSDLSSHEFVIAVNNPEAGLKAFIAIHSSKLGPAHGGTRMKAYSNDAEAIQDVLNLSKAMSYKSALADLPYGGAKGVIVAGEGDNKEKILEAYAKKINQLNGLFRTGTDVGLTDNDISYMATHCKYILGLSTNEKQDLSTSKAAAIGVYYSIKASAKHVYGKSNLKGRVIGIKGVGKLGGELAHLLHDEGAHLILADIDENKAHYLSEALGGVQVVEATTIHKQKMDIYSPCALGNEFTPSIAKELNCKIIAGGANNQLPNTKAGDDIFRRGITYVPDYVANAGGLIFVSEDLEKDGFSVKRVQQRLENIKKSTTRVLERSVQLALPTHRVADAIAEERIIGT